MTRLTDLYGASTGRAAVRWDPRSVDVLSVSHTARTLRAEFIADHLHRGIKAFGRWTGLTALFAALGRRWQHRRTLRALSRLDDRMLSDIGLSRADIQVAAALCCDKPSDGAGQAAPAGGPSVWSRLATRMNREIRRRRTLNELSAMSDGMLADIGIQRADIPAVVAGLFAAPRNDTAPAETAEVGIGIPVTAQVLAFTELRHSLKQAANENIGRSSAA
jgi:uncharacterized protein YjiS (DUF1127 family)